MARDIPARVKLPGTDLILSRIGFGTARLHRLFSSSRCRRLLNDAYNAGITHFDTAPLYGFGLAEKNLGLALTSYHDVTIATKVGLYPPGGANQRIGFVLARKTFGKVIPAISRPLVELSLHRAQTSLIGSLRRLRREYIDILFVHEPEYALVNTEEWQRWLEDEYSRGRVRAFGVAGRTEKVVPFCDQAAVLGAVIQTNDSLFGREADQLLKHGRPLQITYGYLSAAGRTGPVIDSRTLIRAALQRNKTGTILMSTIHGERIKVIANVLHQYKQSG